MVSKNQPLLKVDGRDQPNGACRALARQTLCDHRRPAFYLGREISHRPCLPLWRRRYVSSYVRGQGERIEERRRRSSN